MIGNIRDLFSGSRRGGRRRLSDVPETRLDETVDSLAQIVTPRILAVHGYRKRLREPVGQASEYFRRAADSLVGPMRMVHELWRTDPLLNACFASVESLDAFMHGDPALRGFAEQARQGQAFFLLTMSRRESHVLGSDLLGEIVRADAVQTVETFTSHRALAVAPSLAETKTLLVRAGLERLAAMAAAQITQTHKRIEELERIRATLKHELKLLRLEGQGLGKAFVDADTRRKLAEGERTMREIASDIAQARSEFVELDDYLEFAAHVFEEPAECIAFRNVFLEVNREGIVDDGRPDDPSRPIAFTEIRFPDSTRAAVLAECAVSDILAGRA